MPRKFLKKYLPNHAQVKNYKALGFLRSYLVDKNLWRINRKSIPGAVFIGLFCAFLPIPFQMVPAAALAIFFRKNVPLSIAIVWLSNPITWVPVFYFAYLIGAMILGETVVQLPSEGRSGFDFGYMQDWFVAHYPSILLGGLVCGVTIGGSAFILVDYLWQKKLEHEDAEHDAYDDETGI